MLYNFLIPLLVVFLYAPVFYHLFRVRWDLIDYSHAYFILPVSIGLVWIKRKSLKEWVNQKPENGSHGLFIFIAGLCLFVFGWRMDYVCISTFSLIPVLVGLVLFLYGKEVLKTVLFPILYLIFLVPPPAAIMDGLTNPLQYGVSVVSEYILALFHYPVARDGLLLSMGGTDLFVSQPCSGFRSLITFFALGMVYIHLSRGTLLKKGILFLSVIPCALLGNLVRIITLCLITYYAGEEAAMGFFHNFSGLLIFFIMIICFLLIETLLEKTIK